jgi:hypothetical protein
MQIFINEIKCNTYETYLIPSLVSNGFLFCFKSYVQYKNIFNKGDDFLNKT